MKWIAYCSCNNIIILDIDKNQRFKPYCRDLVLKEAFHQWIEDNNSHNANQCSLPEGRNITANQHSLPEGPNITANQRSLPAVQSETQQEEEVIVAVCGLPEL